MTEVLDAGWFEKYDALGNDVPIYELLREVPDIDGEKVRFFDCSFTVNPNLRPLPKKADEYLAKAGPLQALHDELAESDANQLVKDAYLPVIESRKYGLELLQSAVKGDVEGFIAAGDKSYSPPSQDVFYLLTDTIQDWALAHRHGAEQPVLASAAQQVVDLLPTGSTGLLWPSSVEFTAVQDLYTDFFDEMFNGVEIPEQASGEVVVAIIKQVVRNLGYDEYEIVPQTAGVSTMAVNHRVKRMKVPMEEVYNPQRLRGLLGHELRVHRQERENGQNQPLRLLGKSGLSGFSYAGEGKGVLVEQVAYQNLDEFMLTRRFFDIARRQLSISLARGIDGQERDFKEVFAIIHPLDRLWELSQRPDAEPAEITQRAFDRTWELLSKRTLKGAVGKGVAHLKDKIYAEGNLPQWQLLIDHPEVYPYLSLGHYDLTKPEHVRILKAIGTIPTQLLAEGA